MNTETENTMTLLKSINAPNLLLPYEQMYIQTLHLNNELIPEQHPNEPNPMFRLFHINNTRHTITMNSKHQQSFTNLPTARSPKEVSQSILHFLQTQHE